MSSKSSGFKKTLRLVFFVGLHMPAICDLWFIGHSKIFAVFWSIFIYVHVIERFRHICRDFRFFTIFRDLSSQQQSENGDLGPLRVHSGRNEINEFQRGHWSISERENSNAKFTHNSTHFYWHL